MISRLKNSELPLYLALVFFLALILSLWAGREKTPDVLKEYQKTLPEVLVIGLADAPAFSTEDFRMPFLNMREESMDISSLLAIKKPSFVFLFSKPEDNQDTVVSLLVEQNIRLHILSRPTYASLRSMGAQPCEFGADGKPKEIAYKRLLLQLAIKNPEIRDILNLSLIGQFIETHKKPCTSKN